MPRLLGFQKPRLVGTSWSTPWPPLGVGDPGCGRWIAIYSYAFREGSVRFRGDANGRTAHPISVWWFPDLSCLLPADREHLLCLPRSEFHYLLFWV